MDPQLLVDVLDMGTDGVDAEEHLFGDFRRGQASGQITQHVQFPLTERFHQGLAGRLGFALPAMKRLAQRPGIAGVFGMTAESGKGFIQDRTDFQECADIPARAAQLEGFFEAQPGAFSVA